MPKRFSLLFFLICAGLRASGQTAPADSTQSPKPLRFSAYADVYYLYDFNQPPDRERPPFVYQYSRHDEFNLNNAILLAEYAADRVRGNVGLHTGTYVQRNYAAEEWNGSEVLKFIYQANAGVRLARQLWLDVGILPSHIGYESAVALDNPTVTRSIMADNTPYYETGARLTWEVNDRLTLTGLVLNGWQRILETDNNKPVGTQIQYKPAAGILLNSSTFFGREGTRRYFHNFYAEFDPTDQLKVVTAFDIGWQERLDPTGRRGGFDKWWNPNLIVRYQPAGHWAVTARLEYYHDPSNVIIPQTELEGRTVTSFRTFSPSLNLDYRPAEQVALRLEGRLYRAANPVFVRGNALVPYDALLVASLALRL
jgi:hypothetical protein